MIKAIAKISIYNCAHEDLWLPVKFCINIIQLSSEISKTKISCFFLAAPFNQIKKAQKNGFGLKHIRRTFMAESSSVLTIFMFLHSNMQYLSDLDMHAFVNFFQQLGFNQEREVAMHIYRSISRKLWTRTSRCQHDLIPLYIILLLLKNKRWFGGSVTLLNEVLEI